FGENYGNWLDTFITWDGNIRTLERCTLNAARDACTDTAQFTTTETYDSLLRLTELKTEDALGGTNSVRYQKFEYDHNNQNTFSSFVSDFATETKGTDTTYDALQRVKSKTSTGRGTIFYNYLSGNKIKVTDAEDNITTTSYLAYGYPSYQQATKIESEESVTTDIAVNVLGLVDSVTQTGLNESTPISQTEANIYNTNQQLCLKVRTDVGATAYGYNALGEMTWSAQGVAYNKITP
ncbi:MAG: hypothetical protein GY928_13025, partial [Colwellia sp.]|nr:hypothetical protein [Colwellia sp.]